MVLVTGVLEYSGGYDYTWDEGGVCGSADHP